ncbi:hypothetical protein [Dictyobacter aurantiacus]|uniref:Uncharacterized protein n=1 Tax=Dictyobacter aurantiacus TaxID=1936993 RepID=A0A401ZKZ2_9CHLR|nr:hypothetical protein [Dictyobacter aurantiacus]GCE07551.1 hypothetical protein KDAU_48800 [Dictyobacter aurantiacus]
MGTQPLARLMCNIEIAPDNEYDADVMVVHEVGRELISALQQDGYAVASVYKGNPRGIGLFYQVASGNVPLEGWPDEETDMLEGLKYLLQTVSPIARTLWMAGRRALQAPASLSVALALEDIELNLDPRDMDDEEGISLLAQTILQRYSGQHLPSSQHITLNGKIARARSGRRGL